jgi:DNA-binding CsgD family transcriptional regulator
LTLEIPRTRLAATEQLVLPQDVLLAFEIRRLGPRVQRMGERMILSDPKSYFAWARANPECPTLALSASRVVALGFLGGHLVPPESPEAEDLVSFLKSVLQGAATLRTPSLANRVRLTRRERQVVEGLVRGFSVADIATELGISQSTVRQYVLNLRNKLGAPSLTLALLKAAQHGIIDWPPLPGRTD